MGLDSFKFTLLNWRWPESCSSGRGMARLLLLNSSSVSAILIAMAMAGCAPSTSTHGPAARVGGQDSGGGHTLLSTEAQVVAAIDRAYRILQIEVPIEESARRSPQGKISRALLYLELAPNENISRIIARIFPTGNGQVDYAFDYLTRSKILLRGSSTAPQVPNATYEALPPGPCVDEHSEFDAAVSAHRIGADICFNVLNLRRLSPEILLREIYCLWIHETAHLNGLGETDAIAIQAYISQNYDRFSPSGQNAFNLDFIDMRIAIDALFGVVDALRAGSRELAMYHRGIFEGVNFAWGRRNDAYYIDPSLQGPRGHTADVAAASAACAGAPENEENELGELLKRLVENNQPPETMKRFEREGVIYKMPELANEIERQTENLRRCWNFEAGVAYGRFFSPIAPRTPLR